MFTHDEIIIFSLIGLFILVRFWIRLEVSAKVKELMADISADKTPPTDSGKTT